MPCDKCFKYNEQKYKLCPKCGYDFNPIDINKLKQNLFDTYKIMIARNDENTIASCNVLIRKIPNTEIMFILISFDKYIHYKKSNGYNDNKIHIIEIKYTTEIIDVINYDDLINKYYPQLNNLKNFKNILIDNLNKVADYHIFNTSTKSKVSDNLYIIHYDINFQKPVLPISIVPYYTTDCNNKRICRYINVKYLPYKPICLFNNDNLLNLMEEINDIKKQNEKLQTRRFSFRGNRKTPR